MSGIKVHNESTEQWETIASGDAGGIRTTNPNLKKSDNVDEAITELSERVDNLKNNVAWIYKNGTIGGGGGGTTPVAKGTIRLIGIPENPYYVSTSQSISIQVLIESRYNTNFTLTGQLDQQRPRNFGSIAPNRPVTWDIGRLSKGTHTLFFTGNDVDLIPIEPLTLTIVSGALEINSTFNDKVTFDVASNIVIPYTVSSYNTDPVNVVWQVNNEPPVNLQNVELDKLLNFSLGVRPVGSYSVSGYAYSNAIPQSNVLNYTVNVGADENIFLVVDKEIREKGLTFSRGIPIKVPFSIINNKYRAFKVYWEINGMTGDPKICPPGPNEIEINSDDLVDGSYKLKLTASDLGDITFTEEELIFDIHISSTGFVEWQPYSNGLLAHFVSRGGNTSATQWVNKISSSGITCDLFGINGDSNGFKTREGESDTSLILNGGAYARINYKPFSREKLPVTNGVTISLLFNTHNYGNARARVIDCSDYTASGNGTQIRGLYIDTEESRFKTQRYESSTLIAEDEWLHYTFVLTNKFLFTYANGVLTTAQPHNIVNANDTSMNFDTDIYLGCRPILTVDESGNTIVQLDNFADVAIKDVKVYSTALTHTQVVYNYVADDYYLHTITNPETGAPEYDIQRQKDLRKINSFSDDGDFVVDTRNTANFPIVDISFYNKNDADNMLRKINTTSWGANSDADKFEQVRCRINYIDWANNSRLVDREGRISLQGTSSTAYTSKNFELYLGNSDLDASKLFLWTPKRDSWLPENRFTLKVNMMDSSHANNVATGRLLNTPYRYINDQGAIVEEQYFRTPVPPKQITSDNPSVIEGQPGGGHVVSKIKNAIDGFPVIVRMDFQEGEPRYMGIHTFNLGRGSFYNLGMMGISFNESDIDADGRLSDNHRALLTGIYAPDRAFAYEVDTSDYRFAGAFADYQPIWVGHEFTRRYPATDSAIGTAAINTLVRRTSETGDPVQMYTPKDAQNGDWTGVKLDGQFTESLGNDSISKDQFMRVWNISSLADYLVLTYVLGMVDNMGKNLLLKTWNKEEGNTLKQWFATFYDMDTILGLSNDGLLAHGPDVEIDAYPTGDYQQDFIANRSNWGAGSYNAGRSRLWERYRNWFMFLAPEPNNPPLDLLDNLQQAYYMKRKSGVLSLENLMSHFTNIIHSIGANYYNLDAEIKYLNEFEQANVIGYHNTKFLHGTREFYTKQWLRRRLAYLDSLFNVNVKDIKDNLQSDALNFRFNAEGAELQRNFNITTRSPMFVTVRWQGQDTGNFNKKLVKATTPTNFSQTFAANEQQTQVDSASQIVTFTGINDSRPSSLDLQYAASLTEIDLVGNRYLRSLNLSGCVSLRRLNVANCTLLGQLLPGDGDSQSYIDVTNSKNLEYLNVSNTKITSLNLPNGGVLKELICDNTSITELNIVSQPFLKKVDLSNCTELASINLSNCPLLEEIVLSNTGLRNFSAVACNGLKKVNLSGSFALTAVSFEGAPNVEELNISECRNTAFIRVNLQGATGLKSLTMSNCNASILDLHTNSASLTTLIANGSLLTQTTYNNTPTTWTGGKPAVDLNRYPNLSDFYFANCNNLVAITNLKPTAAVTGARTGRFSNCANLERITGNITFTGSAASTFANCRKFKLYDSVVSSGIIQLPADNATFPLNLNLTNVTSLQRFFDSCVSIDIGHIYYVLRRAINNTNLAYFNYLNSGVVTNTNQPLPAVLFEKQTKVTTIEGVFWGNGNMTGELPETLLYPMVNLTNMQESFRGTRFNYYPQAFLFRSSKVTNTLQMFMGCVFNNTIDSTDLLSGMKALTTATRMFVGTNLGVRLKDDDLFRFNGNLTEASEMFSGCNFSGNLHANLFGGVNPNGQGTENGQSVTYSYPVRLNNANSLFKGSSLLKGKLDSALFSKLTNVTNLGGMFSGTSVGDIVDANGNSIPADLFANNPFLSDVSFFFENTAPRGVIPSTLFDAQGNNLRNVSGLFKGCVNLSAIPNRLFDNNTRITNASQLFNGCTGLQGTIPEDFFYAVNPNTGSVTDFSDLVDLSNCFRGCFYLSGEIPENLFLHTPAVTTLAGFFYECGTVGSQSQGNGITGHIPPKLLRGMTNLRSISGMFYRCNKLSSYTMPRENASDPIREVYVHPDFFLDNTLITDCSSAFVYLTGFDAGAEIPVGLFDGLRNLSNISGIFYNSLRGNTNLESLLFYNNTKLTNISNAFSNESAVTSSSWTGSIPGDLFLESRHSLITNAVEAFAKNSALSGQAVLFQNWRIPPSGTRCYSQCTNLSNYNAILSNWK